jgi:hypothetical protein
MWTGRAGQDRERHADDRLDREDSRPCATQGRPRLTGLAAEHLARGRHPQRKADLGPGPRGGNRLVTCAPSDPESAGRLSALHTKIAAAAG